VVVKGVVVDRLGGKAKVSAVSFEGSSAKGGSNELKLSRNSFNKQPPPPTGGELQVLFAMKIDLGTSAVCKTLRHETGDSPRAVRLVTYPCWSTLHHGGSVARIVVGCMVFAIAVFLRSQ
jgi:hypothetical protein